MSDATAKPSSSLFKRLTRRRWMRVMWYVVLAYILWCAVLYFQQDRMIFMSHMAAAPLPGPPDGVISITLPIGNDETVEAWFYPAPGASPENPKPVVVYFHGNAELIDFQDRIVEGYHRLGFSVLLPEYRGYGRSGGKPSQKALLSDNLRFYDELIRREDVDKDRIVFHGRSLGGGPALDLAAHREPAAVIVESAFYSVISISRRYLVPDFLARHPFRNDRVLAKLDKPSLIFHGRNDRIVPVRHGRKLKAVARNATYIEFDCHHNDFPGEENLTAYWTAVEDFLRTHDILPEPPRNDH